MGPGQQLTASLFYTRIDDLIEWGVGFDRRADGSLMLGREAGHCDVHPVGAVTVGLAGEQLAA